jgi:hypothetical protein
MTSSQPKYYAGIGSRHTPPEARDLIRELARELSNQGYTLRSGGAEGADTFFEEAAGRKEIFLPWKGFNNRSCRLTDTRSEYIQSPTDDAIALASRIIDKYNDRNRAVRMLLARNMHQVMGEDLKTPVEFVICWTQGVGGTGHAIKLARLRGIPVYNLARPAEVASLRQRVFQRELF